MFAVIFEVQPKKERWDDYLALAKQLKPKLEAIAGFIDNERFGSKKTEGRVLSLTTWESQDRRSHSRSQNFMPRVIFDQSLHQEHSSQTFFPKPF